MARLRRSATSKRDLLEIWLYVAEESQSISRADAVIDAIERILILITANPGIGSKREELAPGIRSFPVFSYLVFFRKAKRSVELVRVLHGARDLRKLFGRWRR